MPWIGTRVRLFGVLAVVVVTIIAIVVVTALGSSPGSPTPRLPAPLAAPPAPIAAPPDRLLECVRRAHQDAQKLRACAHKYAP